jgi:tetratricopeptide (TPR) repeat protein
MDNQLLSVKAIFERALEMEGPAERQTYLDKVCAGAADLRPKVEALLQAYQDAGSFLESPAPGLLATVDALAITEWPGAVIGPYKLLEQIGEGGFGVVFMAEQTQPVRRKVALKVLKPGMDTRKVVARFEAERQALALMDHPNIARVLDGGQTPSGRPYVVMDLVKGLPITEYCDQAQLTTRERLELFLYLCQAVQHAHQKGVIHRDLKPSNVLVTVHDTTPVVKVIDFGVAKALGQELTDKTLFTGFAQMVGTPLYMSPEQAGQNGLDIDTRTDIYALGVLLYELLTGTTPYGKERFQEAGYDEIRRIIREEEPPRPSTRMSTLGQAAATVSTKRNSDPGQLRRLFRGELDWIVMKALEKDRNRRYETASGFARDIQRYLADEPVLACPPSVWYRFCKLARRNKALFATAAVVMATLLLASAAVTWKWLDADAARQAESLAKDQAKEALALAQKRGEQLRQDLDRLNAANRLVESAHLLATQGHWHEAERKLTEATMLRPDNSYTLSQRGELYLRLGLWDLAAADFAKIFQLGASPSPHTWFCHALLRLQVGDLEGYRKVAARLPQHFKQTRADRISAGNELARALALAPAPDVDLGWAAEQAELAVKNDRGAYAQNALGLVRYRAGKYEQALGPLREAIRLHGHWRYRILSHSVLAMALHGLGQPAQARQALGEAAQKVEQWRQSLLGRSVNPAGATWWDVLEGLLLYREARILLGDSAPADDPRELVMRGRGLTALKRDREAAECRARALQLSPHDVQIRLALLPPQQNRQQMAAALAALNKLVQDHPEQTPEGKRALAEKYCDLAWQLRIDKRYEDAVQAYTQAIDVVSDFVLAWRERATVRLRILKHYNAAAADWSKVIELDPMRSSAWNNRGASYDGLRQYDKAIADYAKAIELDPKLAAAWSNRGDAYSKLHQYDKAIADCSKAIELAPRESAAWSNRGLAYFWLRQYGKAISDCSKAIELDPNSSEAWNNRGAVYDRLHQHDRAVVDLSKAIELDPKCSTAWSNRGLAHQGLRQHDQAIADLNKAIELDPKSSAAWNNRGSVYRRLRQYDRAIADCSKAIELDGNSSTAWNNRGLAYHALHLYDKAIADLNKAIKLDSMTACVWVNRGVTYNALRQYDKAIADCSKAIELDPTSATAWNDRGYAYNGLHQYDKAVADLSKAIELSSNNAAAWINRGTAYAELAQWQKAATDLAKVTELQINKVTVWYRRAVLCLKLGDQKAYRQVCAAMLDSFRDALPETARLVAWTCVLGPDGVVKPGPVVELAEQRAAQNAKNRSDQTFFGAALYRAGRFKEAQRRLDQAAKLPADPFQPVEHTWLFLAMTHQRLGHAKEARVWLEKASQQMEQTTKGVNPPWNRRLTSQLLRGEAEALLGIEKRESGVRDQGSLKKQSP